MRNLFLLAALSWGFHVHAQTTDSTWVALQKLPRDTAYVSEVNDYSFGLILKSPTSALPLIQEAIEVADSLGFQEGMYQAIANKGSAYWSVGLPDLALKYYLQAEQLAPVDKPLVKAALYNNIGEVFKKKGQLDSAVFYYRKGIRSAANDTPVILVYNLGEAFLLDQKIDSARLYLETAYQNALEKDHSRGLAYSLSGKGELSLLDNRPKEAATFFEKGLRIRQDIGDTRGIIQSHYSLAKTHQQMGISDAAVLQLNNGMELSRKSGATDLLAQGHLMLADLYRTQKKYEAAFDHMARHYALKDSLSSVVFVENIDQVKSALTAELQATENQLLKESQERAKTESKSRFVLITALFVFLVLMGLYIYQVQSRRAAIKSTETNRRIIEALQKVSKLWTSSGFEPFLEDVLRIAGEALEVKRISFWKFDPNQNAVVVTNYHSSNQTGENIMGHVAYLDKFPKYFRYLHEERLILAEDTQKETKLVEFDREYLRKNRIRSLMDVEVRSEDNFIGILSFEQTEHTRSWSYSDRRFASSLANIISSAYFLEQNRQLLMRLFSKNQQLRESASMLSHDLREPLAQIMGFSKLSMQQTEGGTKEIWQHVDKAARQIDQVIRDLTAQLHQQEPVD